MDAYDDPNVAGDLHQFDLKFGLPDPSFTKVNQSGGSTPPAANGGWASEIALDVEWAHAIAPAAGIVLVEANSASYADLLTAVGYAAGRPGVVVVSMSWGGGEFSGETGYDSTFQTPAGHAGVTFVASSGDSGAPASYPATSPNVLAVGGTTLKLDGSNNISSETAWSGSGGGLSSVEAQPAYQQGVVTQSSTQRANPDVAYDADPNTGFPVYDSYNNGTAAPWSQFGGTSDAAPQWAALVAIADQGRIKAGSAALDGPTQTLPKLYALPAADFHDITSGSSTGSPNEPAGPGYDLATGRGTPVANLVVADLVGAATAAATHFSVTAPAGSTAGAGITVTVTALDSSGNVVPTYAGTVHFTSTDGAAALPADYTFTAADAGAHSFAVTLKTAGGQTVTATDTAGGGITGQAGVTVSAAAASALTLSAPGTVTQGAPFSVTATARDAYGNLATGYTGTVHFTTSDTGPGVALPGDYAFTAADGGAHTFTGGVTLVTLGAQTVTATDTVNAGLAGQTGVNVTAVAATHLGVSAPAGSTAGAPFSVTVTALDANNNPVAGYTGTVHFTTTDKGAGVALPADYTFTAADNGAHTFTSAVTLVTAGGQTVTAADTGGGVSGSAQVTVSPAAASKLVFGQQPTNTTAGAVITPAVTVRVLDAYGNLVSGDSTDQVTLALGANPGGGALAGTTTVTVSGGVATFANLSVTAAGNGYTLTAGSGALAGATSAAFNVSSASAVIEDFESPGNWYVTGYGNVNASRTTQAAHAGTYGLDMYSGSDWIYRSDAAAQVKAGDTLSVWVRFDVTANGRAYFGFGASSGGTLSLVAAPNTGQLVLQQNLGYGYQNLAAAAQTYQANHWYRLEVDWGTSGTIVGKLFDSNGTTLLRSVTAATTAITSGGIAFRSIGNYDKYFDTVTATRGVNNFLGGAQRHALAAAPSPGGRDAGPAGGSPAGRQPGRPDGRVPVGAPGFAGGLFGAGEWRWQATASPEKGAAPALGLSDSDPRSLRATALATARPDSGADRPSHLSAGGTGSQPGLDVWTEFGRLLDGLA